MAHLCGQIGRHTQPAIQQSPNERPSVPDRHWALSVGHWTLAAEHQHTKPGRNPNSLNAPVTQHAILTPPPHTHTCPTSRRAGS